MDEVVREQTEVKGVKPSLLKNTTVVAVLFFMIGFLISGILVFWSQKQMLKAAAQEVKTCRELRDNYVKLEASCQKLKTTSSSTNKSQSQKGSGEGSKKQTWPPNMSDLDLEQIKRSLLAVFSGEVVYETNPTIGIKMYVYSKEPFLLKSYKYVPGSGKFSEGYEGFSWERNLDDEVAQFSALKEGKQIAKFYDVVGGKTETETLVKILGKRKYAIVDNFFPPAAAWNRTYYTYDDDLKQLVYINFNIYDYNNEIGREKSGQIIEYPEEISNFLSSFEEEILAQY